MLTLYGCHGCGSVIVEAACTLLDEPYRFVAAEPWTEGPERERLRAVNPLLQVPTLELPDGTVMTESVAILLWLLERHPGSGLAPDPGAPLRPAFLRWLVYFPAAIYPMYTVGDFPDQWVEGDEAQARLKQATMARTLRCWRTLDQGTRGLGTDWLLGDRMSLLDLYAAMLSHWEPGREQIRAVAPRAVACAERAEADPRLLDLWTRNFPPKD